MNTGEDIIGVVQTSDAEEQEGLEAQKPGYYDKIWGASTEARLQPRTSHRRAQDSNNSDPSPLFSPIKITAQLSDPTPKTPTTNLTSNHLEQSITTSSSVTPTFRTGAHRTRMPQRRLPGGVLHSDDEEASSQDPLCLLSPIISKLSLDMPREMPHINPRIIHDDLGHIFNNTITSTAQFPLRMTGIEHPSPATELPSSPFGSFALTRMEHHSSNPLQIRNISKPQGHSNTAPHTPTWPPNDWNNHSPDGDPGEAFNQPEYPSPRSSSSTRPSSQPDVRNISTPLPSPAALFRPVTPTRMAKQAPFGSMSPPTPPSMQSPNCETTITLVQGQASSPIDIEPDPEPQGRIYSLRHRSEKQLNPFEYDKRQYKRQLRGIPEAIIKDSYIGRTERRDRYREDGDDVTQHNDWENERADDDGDEEWRARERRRERQRQQEILDAKMRELGVELPSSEEETLTDISKGQGEQTEQEKARGKKRKRGQKVHKFPLTIGLENDQTAPRRASAPSNEPAPRPRPRPRPRPDFNEASPSPPRSISQSYPRGPSIQPDMSFGTNRSETELDGTGYGSNEIQPDAENIQANNHDDKGAMLLHLSDEVSRPRRSRVMRGRPRKDAPQDVIVPKDYPEGVRIDDDDEGTSSQESEVELSPKARKQMKVLSRMMPAAHLRRLLEGKKPISKEKPASSHKSYEEETGAPLVPGRGIKRIVSPNSRDPKRYEIKGDTESETEDQTGAFATDHEVILIDDESENAESVLDGSDGGLDGNDIHAWLAPRTYAQMQTQGGESTSKIRRSDHERDRPRGGDLVDRMLQRTRRVGPQIRRSASNHNYKTQGAKKPMLDIVTREARRKGAGGGQQTKLNFPNVPRTLGLASERRQPKKIGRRDGSPYQADEHHMDMSNEKRRKKRKEQRKDIQSDLFIVRKDGHKVTSGRLRQIIHIDVDDDALHDVLASEGVSIQPRARPIPETKAKFNMDFVRDPRHRCRGDNNIELDAFGANVYAPGQRHSKISLDFDIPLLPVGITLDPNGYVGKGRLFNLIFTLKGCADVSAPFSATILGVHIDPGIPVSQMSTVFASACDKLFNTSIMSIEDPELLMTIKATDSMMLALCQLVTFKARYVTDEEIALLVRLVSEQTHHLIGRIKERLDLLSADGHSLDSRSFSLYWFALELHLRIEYVLGIRADSLGDKLLPTKSIAEGYGVQLFRRLLEYGLDRVVGLFEKDGSLDVTSANVRILDLWISIFHIAPFLSISTSNMHSKPVPPFWRIAEAALEAQSNKQDSQLYQSEHIWHTVFSLCAISQFSSGGITTVTVRSEAYWPIVKKALKCIRLSADEHCDGSKPASTLHKRDTYLRLVTARCFLLCIRWKWRLYDADDMFHELWAIFRSRQFSNLLGEPDDFPAFIRDKDVNLFEEYQTSDTAYALFLKLIVHAAKDFNEMDSTGRLRTVKLARLLSLAVPVGSTSFTRVSPPVGQGLSMLFNRYSAIFVAIYVDPSDKHIRSRLQQVRRYITFKDADYDSRTAAIRTMMHLAILLRHLHKPLDDVLSWASEMMQDLSTEFIAEQSQIEEFERGKLVIMVQLLLRTIRTIINNATLNLEQRPAVYPDIDFLQAWMPHVLRGQLAKDHRTGLEICHCIQTFLDARKAIIPPPPIPKPIIEQTENQESQDEFGDGGLDLYDPDLFNILAGFEKPSDKITVADQKTSEVLDLFSQQIYTCVCMHLGCNSSTFGHPYQEADTWLQCWLGCGAVLIFNGKREWDYYFQLAESAWKDIDDPFRRSHLRLRCMLTVLQLDPQIYKSHAEALIQLWFETVLMPEITIQHEYTAQLFSVDGLHHILFRDVPCAIDPGTGMLSLSLTEFKELRIPIIRAIISSISNATEQEKYSEYIALLGALLDVVRQWIKILGENNARILDYIALSKQLFSLVRDHDNLAQHPKFEALLNWNNSL